MSCLGGPGCMVPMCVEDEEYLAQVMGCSGWLILYKHPPKTP